MTNASRPVVLIAEKLAPSVLDALGDEVEIRHVDGTDRPALLDAVRDADALLVRSATKVDAEVLAATTRLKVVARAGVGLDNVEVPAATERGVMVVNAPTSNIVSAAEHAVALLLAVARNVAAADASLRAGEWKRSSFSGVELNGKTVGVVGLGKIGQLFAQRIAAFGTELIAYDPYVSPARAAQLGIELVSLEELLERADAISIHLPKTAETLGLIGAEELKRAKKGQLIVNAARGGLIDEEALADAIRSGHIGGAGIDVYKTEPTTSSPLFELTNVVATPHLGASTAEAQDRAGTDVARSVLLALRGDFVPDAVNVQGGAVGEEVRPYLPLTQKLGQVLAAVLGSTPSSVTVEARGELADEDVSVLQLAALRGVFSGAVENQVTFVNAPQLAEELGVSVEVQTSPESPNHRSVVSVRAGLPDGRFAVVSGALTGRNLVEKIVEVNGRHFDLRAEGNVLLLEYPDRPGVMGKVGTLLGEVGVNIEAATVSQTTERSDAVMLLRVDRPVDAGVLEPIGAAVGARVVRAVTFE
ncbi:D-3-phosphoglycerate dehydrogenase [Saccharopolyspora erythraea NRRL 2338]|uniref:D-3-phosphoglycerate dehydrogenase n=2 Tax=Saccharopolyspora erythraea TaxID=1836 RepID=A4FMQ3_SACEN|nr:phosphoglycerate dehydrogenase [Saccharopolyspora erythraea]EQD85936.1 3-phosphoglycerate dehydrogenase [Saccharopolyspora erythraea D]PFG98973.1 D-3-phosphoglycerate dehydrogenase [Saccharopolyspora erythraea NRRL 2338]QRK88949.1 phosphoglycerate dehydrogenase [Saccharopolyspora erythraea]CAM05328.1 D-3-phosphoglycerate dehydrogenase (PgdH) [Saccharopolyspora erythraea NRRL 2338]